jgi:Tfp pilus assembly protein PilN
MKYRLNLYTEQFRPRRIGFNRWLFGVSLVSVALLLIAGGVGLHLANRGLVEQHRQLSDQQAKLQARMLMLSKQMQANTPDQALLDAIVEITDEIASKRQMLEYLDRSPLLTETRFSHFMQGLSNSHVQGLWLTRVRAEGNNLMLDGRSLSEELLPQWISRLSSQTNFRGKKFNALELNRPQDNLTSQLDFHLSTQVHRVDDNNG